MHVLMMIFLARSSTVHCDCSGLRVKAFRQSAWELLQSFIDSVPASFQLPCLTWNTLCCWKRKLNQWPQSNYISRPAGGPPVYVLLLCVAIVSTMRAFCHLPAGFIRVLRSCAALEKVIHTTGGSIHTTDSPQSCLLCHIDSSLKIASTHFPVCVFTCE